VQGIEVLVVPLDVDNEGEDDEDEEGPPDYMDEGDNKILELVSFSGMLCGVVGTMAGC
jgi:hypothetical protein